MKKFYTNDSIKCPFCRKELKLIFILEDKGQMSRLYAYCDDCQCGITKTIKRAKESQYL